MSDGIWGCVIARVAFTNVAGRCLQEAAISANDFVLWIACEGAERGGTVDDGMVESAGVYDDEGAFEIDGAKDDVWVGPSCDASENAEKIETGGRVDGKRRGDGSAEDGEVWWSGGMGVIIL